MEYRNLKFLQDVFFHTQNICSWTITSDMQLLYSNCPEQEFFFNLFLVSSCRTAMQTHFSASNSPLIVSFVWIAACESAAPDKVAMTYLLGPIFTSEITEKHLHQHCRKMRLSAETIERLWRFIRNVPTISINTASCYASMLHYCVTGCTVTLGEVQMQNERIDHTDEVAWGDTNWHGSWVTEQRLFKSIMEGRYEDFGKVNTGSIGNIGGGDSLRQAKNEIIVFATLCSCAAILGGVSSEGALNLSDHFIQLVEAADSVQEVMNLGGEMHQAYIQRVQKAKANSSRTALVRACMDYVDTHILEKISLTSMAQEVGYNEHYISRKFKSETGESLVDYINRQKIQLAKIILKDTKLSVTETSDRLAFSSPSYFSSVFKKQAGVSPAEYQQAQRDALL